MRTNFRFFFAAAVLASITSACGGSTIDDGSSSSGSNGQPNASNAPSGTNDPNANGNGPTAVEIAAPPDTGVQSFNDLPVGSSRNDLWLHSNTKDESFFWHWDGKVWSKVPLPFGVYHAVDLVAASPGVVWVAGDSCGGVSRLDADGHSSFAATGKTTCHGGAITMDSGGEASTAVMIDEDGTPYRLQSETNTFTPMPLPTSSVEASKLGGMTNLRVVTSQDVWAWSGFSNGGLWHFDGAGGAGGAGGGSFQRVPNIENVSSKMAMAIFAKVVWDVQDVASLSPPWAHRGPSPTETNVKAWSLRRITLSSSELVPIPVPADIPGDGAASYTGVSVAAARNGNPALLGCVFHPTAEQRSTYVPDLMAAGMPGYLVVHEWDGSKLTPRTALPKTIACPARDKSNRAVAEVLPRPLLDGTWIYRSADKYVLIDP